MTGNNLIFEPGMEDGNGQKEYWTTEHVVDRLQFEIVEKKDDAQ